MFENNTGAYTDAKQKVRYEPIERRRVKRRSVVNDRRSEVRDEQEQSDRREKSDRRNK